MHTRWQKQNPTSKNFVNKFFTLSKQKLPICVKNNYFSRSPSRNDILRFIQHFLSAIDLKPQVTTSILLFLKFFKPLGALLTKAAITLSLGKLSHRGLKYPVEKILQFHSIFTNNIYNEKFDEKRTSFQHFYKQYTDKKACSLVLMPQQQVIQLKKRYLVHTCWFSKCACKIQVWLLTGRG